MKKLVILSLLPVSLMAMESNLGDVEFRQKIQNKLLQREILARLDDPQRDLIKELDFLYSLGSKSADEKACRDKNFRSINGIRCELAYQIYESDLIQRISKFFNVQSKDMLLSSAEKSIYSPNRKHCIDWIHDKSHGKSNDYYDYTLSIKNLKGKKIDSYDIDCKRGRNWINSISWTPDDKSVIIDEHRVIDLESLTETLNQDSMKISGNGKWILYHDDDRLYLAQYHNKEKSSIVVKGISNSVKDYAISYDGSIILSHYKGRILVFPNNKQSNQEVLSPSLSIQCPNDIQVYRIGCPSLCGFYFPLASRTGGTILVDFRSIKEPVFMPIHYNVGTQYAWSQDNNLLSMYADHPYQGDSYEYELTNLMNFLNWYNQKAGLGQKLLLKAIYSDRILQEKESPNPRPYRLSYSGLIALFKSLPFDLPFILVAEGWVAIDEQNY